jgi:hypothetical protein
MDNVSRVLTAEPESMYPETAAFEPTRPSGRGAPEQNSTEHSDSYSALNVEVAMKTIKNAALAVLTLAIA